MYGLRDKTLNVHQGSLLIHVTKPTSRYLETNVTGCYFV